MLPLASTAYRSHAESDPALKAVSVRVVEVRREAQPGPILAAARRAADLVLLIQRRRQLADVEGPRLERQHRRAPRRLGARPDLHAVHLLQPLDQRRRQLARALL